MATKICVIGVILCSVASADTLILKDGRSFEGSLLQRDDQRVRFKVVKGGISATTSFEAREVAEVVLGSNPGVASVEKDKAEKQDKSGPTYFVIPIKGIFGLEVTDELLEKSLAAAQRARPTAVVFDVDSVGGYVDELASMFRTLTRYPDLRFVAYVRQAGSCAALFVMACKEVVASPTGIIGACVVYQNGPKKTPKNVTAKLESFERARFRAVATAAGHSPLLVEGMMKTDIVLSVKEKNGRPEVVEGTSGKILKRKGSVLTLTGQEAVACGLALGTADSVDGLHAVLGIEQWTERSSAGKTLWSIRKRKLQDVVTAFEGARRRALAMWRKADSLGTDKEPTRRQLTCLKESENNLDAAIELSRRYPRLFDNSRLAELQGTGQLKDPKEVMELENLKGKLAGKIKTVEANLPKPGRPTVFVPTAKRPTFGRDD